MAPTPSKAAPPMAADDDDDMDGPDGNQGTDDQEDEPSDDDAGGDEDDGRKCLCTIYLNDDGTYQLVPDEDEDQEGEESGSDEGDEDQGEEGESGQSGEEQGQTFQTEGELLKGVLDLVRGAKGGDEAMGDHEFEGGYNEETPPAPPAPAGKQNTAY